MHRLPRDPAGPRAQARRRRCSRRSVPPIDVTAALAVEMPDVQLDDGGPLTAAHVADVVAGALSALALARGEVERPTRPPRAARSARPPPRWRAAELQDARTDHRPRPLDDLVEAVLIEAGQYDVARALVLDRVPAPLAPAPDAPRLIRRNGRRRGVGTRARSRSPSAPRSSRWRTDPAPAGGLAAAVVERARARGLGLLYVPDRDGPGHRPGGARARRPHARRRTTHRLPRRARPAAGAGGAPRRRRSAEADDLRRRHRVRVAIGLDLGMDADELAQELRRSTDAGMHDEDLRRLVVLNAKALVERDSELSRFAGRILLTLRVRGDAGLGRPRR